MRWFRSGLFNRSCPGRSWGQLARRSEQVPDAIAGSSRSKGRLTASQLPNPFSQAASSTAGPSRPPRSQPANPPGRPAQHERHQPGPAVRLPHTQHTPGPSATSQAAHPHPTVRLRTGKYSPARPSASAQPAPPRPTIRLSQAAPPPPSLPPHFSHKSHLHHQPRNGHPGWLENRVNLHIHLVFKR
jgi:hypothetical protein